MSLSIPSHFTTGELGDYLGVQSWKIARLFELEIIDEPARIGGRRLIPKNLVPVVIAALQERNWLGGDCVSTSACQNGGDDAK